MKKIYLSIIIFVGLIIIVNAQTKVDTLTNTKIIKLSKIGLEPSVIIDKIHTSFTIFDISADALINLSNNQVSSDVIKEMMNVTKNQQAENTNEKVMKAETSKSNSKDDITDDEQTINNKPQESINNKSSVSILKTNDTIFQLSNKIIICNINNISEFEVAYNYLGESIINTISIKQIKEIHFGSGRIQKFSDIIIINGRKDWEKVQLTTLQSEVDGLVNKGEVMGKAMGTAMANMTNVKGRAEERIKKAAAKLGAHIVLIHEYNVTDSQPGMTYGKANITGVAYGYK